MPALFCIRKFRQTLRVLGAATYLASSTLAFALPQSGQIAFNGLPVPGAVITATQGSKKVTAVSGVDGMYRFADLASGAWLLHVDMFGFAPLEQSITVADGTPGIRLDLKMLPLNEVLAQTKAVKPLPAAVVTEAAGPSPAKAAASKAAAPDMPKPPGDEPAQSSDGFLVNGSVNNAATSQFSLAQAFGNQRKGSKSLYTGGLGLALDNSALDARPYSLSGLQTPKAAYNRVMLAATFGGPIRIPHLLPRGPNFFIVYQWTRNNDATAQSGLVPTLDQRNGILPGGNIAAISPQAQALLALYPLPNLAGNLDYNYTVPLLNSSHQDAVQARLDKNIGRRDELYGGIASQSTRANNTSLFSFTDRTDTLGLNGNMNWQHRLNHGLYLTNTYKFSRLRTLVSPYFANRSNVSAAAGVSGNDQDAAFWGPPSLVFSSGIASLDDGNTTFDRNRTEAAGSSLQWYRGRHNITVGGDFRRQEFNLFQQQDPRGIFTFTGAASGTSDFADFLEGTPDTSQIAFGNADKYLRQSVYDAYATDDWRLRPELTLNVGVRWEYGSPITEVKNRLANIDVAPGFAGAATVTAQNPKGTLSQQSYPTSLVFATKNRFEPRIGVSWRPIPGSSVVVRAGYGVYSDTSVYEATAVQLAQQAPFSSSLSAQSSVACPLTLANGFRSCGATTADTFGVDPNFRVGYAHTWQLAVQRDLPAALQLTATYLGIKGTRGVQEFLPNTYALGAANPCPLCPVGFVYRTSNGNSTREAGSVQLRRRLRSGFTASLLYTYSKSIDDDSLLGGEGPLAAGTTSQVDRAGTIAQDWRNLNAERSLSSFDQRHLLTANAQYTSGQGLGGGTLLGGWRGRVLKEWTVVTQINAGSGLPETPVYLAAVTGTGFTGSLRPDRTSASATSAPPGHFLNAASYTAPQPGRYGNAGRNSIIGPGQFTLNASLSRTFRLEQKYNLDIRADAANLLNHVVFGAYNTVINPAPATAAMPVLSSPLFGLPTSPGAMRSLQINARLRF